MLLTDLVFIYQTIPIGVMNKIAIVYSRFGPYHIARLRAAQQLFSAHKWDVVGIEICPDDKAYTWNKVSPSDLVHSISIFPVLQRTHLSFKQIAVGTKRILDEICPDAVAVPGWHFAEAVAGLQWCIRKNRMAILMSETCRHDAKRVWWSELIKSYRVRKFSAAVVGGKFHQDYLIKLGMNPTSIFFGHNIVDNEYFRKSSEEARKSAQVIREQLRLPTNYILASGRFLKVKNFLTLLNAYRRYRLSANKAALSLVLCGDGNERSTIEQYIDDNNLRDCVCLPGFIQYDKLPIYYGLATAFIHPSTIEPWGLVVNEAMASGLPVVVSNRCGCVPELIRESINGFTFDPNNIDQLTACLAQIHSFWQSGRLAQMGRASQEIISDWMPERFAAGMWQAIHTK